MILRIRSILPMSDASSYLRFFLSKHSQPHISNFVIVFLIKIIIFRHEAISERRIFIT